MMSESATQSELGQVLDAIKSMRSDIQVLTLEVRTNQETTNEKFNTVRTEIKALDSKVESVRTELNVEIKAVNDKVDALRSELRDDINEVRSQQRTVDARLWAFIVGLVTLVGGSVIKVLWFDRA